MSAASPEYTISHPAGPLDSGLPRTQLETPDHSRRLSGGWKVVARKELADHLRSVRFLLLLVLLGLIGIAAVNSTAGTINDIVGSGPKSTSLFLYLFTGVPEGVVPGSGSNLPSLVTFIGMLGPLLGLAFGFDAVSGERSIRTLPRLVSQPIHRDDVIKGKFASGLTAIALVLGVVIAIVSGLGVLRVGLVPSLADATRVLTYFGLALLYIGLWLGLSILASVRFREASTSALTVIATWMVLTLFLGLATGAIANWVHPVNANPQNEPDRYASQTIQNARFDNSLQKVSPARLYDDASSVILNPFTRTTESIVDPSSADQAIPTPLGLTDSLVVAFAPIAILVGVTLALFVAAFIVFLRQEVRA